MCGLTVIITATLKQSLVVLTFRPRSYRMMSASTRAYNLKLAFLQDAAKSTAFISPSTSSYLGSEYVQMELAIGPQNKAFPDHQRQTFCTACGNVFTPGWNCTIARGDRGVAPDKVKKVQRRTIVYSCQACYHRTPFCLHPSKRPDKNMREKYLPRSKQLDLDVTGHMSSDSTTLPPKTSSKRRAKARKERAGLQALLKKSENERRTSPQLSLMDLMMS